ncbi:hypothetical protein ASPCADRAFT_129201 [Aspergillus carbonarius ITEM 5010]|uniref:Cupin type-1 domain-containing protein n=1 Tax=Aspergillus carbonarius (strain ITEM 5010) TaxID=602072 RepID=A0A1R3RSP4_ASPC5|nr:hypothetical protein ASPCADRAFT_129201 [Aspergillus carbonarius ITEM 5010]
MTTTNKMTLATTFEYPKYKSPGYLLDCLELQRTPTSSSIFTIYFFTKHKQPLHFIVQLTPTMHFPTTKYFNTIILLLALSLQAEALPQPLTTRSNSNSDLTLTAQLRLADTAIERYQLLPNDSDFIFDFTTNKDLPVATSQNWPVLVNVGAAFSISQLPACSMTFLHLHPRATELFAVTSGHLISSMIPEAGVLNANNTQRVIQNDLYPGQVTIYPAGSFHTQVNPDCEPANFTATFTSDEFAVGLVAEQLFSFSDGVIARTFGGGNLSESEIERLRGMIPEDMAIKVEECLGKCGLERK